jgi:hypothetical protein
MPFCRYHTLLIHVYPVLAMVSSSPYGGDALKSTINEYCSDTLRSEGDSFLIRIITAPYFGSGGM